MRLSKLVLFFVLAFSLTSHAQDDVMVDLSVLDGLGSTLTSPSKPLFPILPKKTKAVSKPKIVKKKTFKQKLLSFVSKIDDIDKAVLDFWKEHQKKIKQFYLEMKQDTDIIISASPEFLIAPICHQLGVAVMGTRVDNRTGIFDGENCHGEEKVRRLYEVYPDAEIDEFYSDMYCDTPLARLAKSAYIVKGNKISPWKKF